MPAKDKQDPKHILIVDCETDSPKPQQAQMLEIAIARLNLDNGEAQLAFDSFIRPQYDGWRDCWFVQNAKIPESVIDIAPPIEVVREQIVGILDSAPVTAYNLSFDLQVLFRHGVKIKQVWPCLMLTCKPILKLPGYYGDWKFPKFEEAWAHFFPRDSYSQQHRAGSDVLQEAKLAYALDQKGYFSRKK
jgi:DNA polymerase III subunit epsilon